MGVGLSFPLDVDVIGAEVQVEGLSRGVEKAGGEGGGLIGDGLSRDGFAGGKFEGVDGEGEID